LDWKENESNDRGVSCPSLTLAQSVSMKIEADRIFWSLACP
jgi:hypothetical protein